MTVTAEYISGGYEVSLPSGKKMRFSGILQVIDFCRDNQYHLSWGV